MAEKLIEGYKIVVGTASEVEAEVMERTELGWQCVGEAKPLPVLEGEVFNYFCQTMYKMDTVVQAMLDELKDYTK